MKEECGAATYGGSAKCYNNYATCRWHKGWREKREALAEEGFRFLTSKPTVAPVKCIVFDGKGECSRAVNERGVYCDEHETPPRRCEWTTLGVRCIEIAEYGGRHCAGHAEMNLLLRARRATPLSTAVPARPEPNTVDHPAHYNHGKIEAITVIEDWNLGFNLGNCVKYVARADHKGNAIEDLEKALWYLQRELARRKA